MKTINEKVEEIRKEYIKQAISNYAYCYGLDDDYDESLALPYAEKRFDLFMQLEGPDRLFKSKEVCDGIDLKPYLDKIRHLKEEAVLILATNNDEVIEERLLSDSDTIITYEDYIKNGLFELFKLWKDKNYKVLNYHNHPDRIAARPSNTDIINLNLSTSQNPNIRRMMNQLEINDFDFYDWGVVTDYDFYSEKQEKQSVTLKQEFSEIEKIMMKKH